MKVRNQEMAQERVEQAYNKVPSPENWGFLCHDTGSGLAGMFWFESKQEVLSFLRDDHLSIYIDLDDLSDQEVKLLQEVENLVDIFSSLPSGELKNLIYRYNENVVDIMRIEWTGQFKDILFEQNEFARGVRSSVRAYAGRGDDDAPVAPEEVSTFAKDILFHGA